MYFDGEMHVMKQGRMMILLLEDDAAAARHVMSGMTEIGHDVRWVENGSTALDELLSTAFDVAIIDRMVPGLDGLSLVRQLRATGCSTPVLMLTALGGVEHRVEGLNEGADDYLAKPYTFSELCARVNALGRRPAIFQDNSILKAGAIEMNMLRREVRRDGRMIELQPREFRLLEQLVRNADRVVTRTMLLETVWKFDFDPRTSVVETLVSRLRAKLNEGFADDAVLTVRGAGYTIRSHD